jgi:hypothetical protein
MKELEFIHGISGEQIFIIAHKIFGYYDSTTMKATMLVSDAGAIVPVKQSKEQIKKLLSEAYKEEENGIY